MWRPLTVADVAELARLYAAAERVDPTGEHFRAEDLTEQLTGPNVDLPGASLAAWAGDRMIGYGLIRRRDEANPVHLVNLESIVHPEHRDAAIAAQLIEWFATTSRRIHATTSRTRPWNCATSPTRTSAGWRAC
jgi:hypothetical protein